MDFGGFQRYSQRKRGILAAATKDVVAKFRDGRFRTGAPPLCLQTRRASPLLPLSPFLLSFGRLPLPFGIPLGLSPLSASLPSAPTRMPPPGVFFSLSRRSSPHALASPSSEKRPRSLTMSCPPHHRPLPARPLRFKSPSSVGRT